MADLTNRDRPVAQAAAAVVVAAAAVTWMYSARSFIAEDSYFYAVIARRLALEGRQTFSGVFLTNGFHPLWLYLLAGYATVVKVMGSELLWRANFAVPLSVALAAIGACFLVKAERVLSLRRATLVLPPLVFVSVLGVLYSEAHALLAMLAWLAWLVARADSGQRVSGWLLGSAAAIVVLARLDMIFLAAAVLAWMSVRGRRHLEWAGSAAAAFTLLLVPYLATNLWFFGGLMPISGWVKSSFPVPTPSGFHGSWLSLSDYSVPFGVVPICFAAAVCAMALKRGTAPAVLLVFTAGAIGHMAYTMLFASWCGWHWYYVLAVLTGSLAWSVALRDGGAAGRLIAATQAGALIVLTALGLRFAVTRDNRSPAMRTIQQYLSAPAEAGRTVFVSELPGEAAFLGRSNVIAADMLTASRRVYARIVHANDPWEALLRECAGSGRPLDEVVYIGGAFVARSGNRITWLDPRVSSRRPIATVELGTPVLADDRVPFAVWRVRRTDP